MAGGLSSLTFLLIGAVAGLCSGFFGLGGGVVIVPALVYLAGFTQHQAVGTSLAALVAPLGLGAAFHYYRQGHVNIQAAMLIAVALFATAWLSAKFATRFNAMHLRLAFGVFIILIGLYMVVSTWRAIKN